MTRADARVVFRAMRPQHWVKNFLVFVPLVTGHRIGEWTLVGFGALAFSGFSLAASAGYVLNDVADAGRDRLDPAKRIRPSAAGALGRGAGLAAAAVLGLAAVVLSWWTLPPRFTMVVLAYLAVSGTYSWGWKRVPIVDVLVLAGLYCLRVIGGGIAEATPVSEWLLAFSVFFFLSLAFLKRFTELRRLGAQSDPYAGGRGYQSEDRWVISGAGIACGYVSVLVLALYINSETASRLYHLPELLWLVGPLLLHWITRFWLLAQRGVVDDDPVVFAARDRGTYVTVAMVAVLLYLATVGWPG